LLVDKPPGLTSFDVVAAARRAYGTRRVGHAGTLDPMATGVLVVLLGEATKLSSVLTTERKSYEATVQFGTTTATLDKDGPITKRVPLPHPLQEARLLEALASERCRRDQIPPQVSAIKVDGKRSYAQARQGITVDLVPRAVRVHELELVRFNEDSVRLRLTVSKGYYVRSLARDLADHLGTVAHLTELRRTSSGPFHQSQTSPLPLNIDTPLLAIEEAARLSLPLLHVSELGATCVRQGKYLVAQEITQQSGVPPEAGRPYGVLFEGQLIALVERVEPSAYKVLRGIAASPHLAI
jgi:tRNA pseudouridine55 synthase